MAQFLSDHIKENFRSLHHYEPLKEEDVNWLVTNVQRHFPDATKEEIVNASPFDIAELKEYEFIAKTTVEAYSEQEAKEKFANSSYDFAGQAKCIEVT